MVVGADTLVERFQTVVETHGDREAQRYRTAGGWGAITYEGLAERVRELSLGLQALGVEPGDRVAILSSNRPAWSQADWAILHAGAVTVSIYPTLTPDQTRFLLEDSGTKLLFVEDAALFDLVEPCMDELADLETIVAFEEADAIEPAMSLAALVKQGRAYGQAHPQAFQARVGGIGPEDLVTLIYTSGTTGTPKGVMLTHRNLVSNIRSGLSVIPLQEHEHYLSFLPLSHSYERSVGHFLMAWVGATVWFAESIETIGRDLQDARPTIFLAVPRLYEKMRARIEEKVRQASPVRQALFDWARRVGAGVFEHQEAGTSPPLSLALQHGLADRLVLSKLREAMGLDRMAFAGSGAAALEREVASFFGSLGLLLLEGYGMTETSPVISFNRPDAFRVGSVGKPIPGVEVRLDEEGWPVEGQGEIWARGDNVMEGYWQRPEATKEALTEEGWMRTGDVGRFDEDGFLWITDRKKQLFKTAYGKYVAPAQVEGLVKNSRFVDLCMAVGAERKYVAALIVPDLDAVRAWCQEHDVAIADTRAMLASPEVQDLFQQAVGKANDQLARHEQIKTFEVIADTWEPGEELTPTLKIKRRVVEDRYASTIEALYPDD